MPGSNHCFHVLQAGFRLLGWWTDAFRTQALDDEPCTFDVQGTLCAEPVSQVCVPKVTGSFDYRLCMLYCPGGTMLPLAKPYFYVSKAQAATTIQNPGVDEYRPVIESCLPSSACLNEACLHIEAGRSGRRRMAAGGVRFASAWNQTPKGNQCNTGYEGPNCGGCVFGYFQDLCKYLFRSVVLRLRCHP